MHKSIVKISKDGVLRGLHSDFLAGLGKAKIQRASNVEFDNTIGRWVVELLIGKYKNACLIRTFEHRSHALDAEAAVLNEQLANNEI